MRKKVLAVLLAGTMALAMGACGQGNGTEKRHRDVRHRRIFFRGD